MAIIRMIDNNSEIFPNGAACSLEYKKSYGYEIVLYETHKGLCLEDREHNMRDDSDFYMTVWNPEKNEPESIMFASTRGWTYPCYGSRVDATPEVQAAYDAWKVERNRRYHIMQKWNERAKMNKIVKDTGLDSRKTLMKLRETASKYAGGEDVVLPAFIKLLTTLKKNTFRSAFRKSLAEQLYNWITSENNIFDKPLSFKQVSCLTGF